jgi:hypothetical protein
MVGIDAMEFAGRSGEARLRVVVVDVDAAEHP